MENTLHHHIAIAYSPNSSIEVDQTSLPPPPCLTLGPRWDQTKKALASNKRFSKTMFVSRAWPRDHPTLNVGVTGGRAGHMITYAAACGSTGWWSHHMRPGGAKFFPSTVPDNMV